jgi:hypothetical protein
MPVSSALASIKGGKEPLGSKGIYGYMVEQTIQDQKQQLADIL